MVRKYGVFILIITHLDPPPPSSDSLEFKDPSPRHSPILTVSLRGVASLNSMNPNVDWMSSGSHANTSTMGTANASQFQFQQWNQSQYHSTMCTHTLNTAAHLPNPDEESSKRQRDDPAAFFLVSQDEESSTSSCTGMEMEMDSQSDETYPAANHHRHQKRQRFCREVEGANSYGNLLSPGSVSITTTSTNHAATPKSDLCTSLSAKKNPQTKPPVVEWWKQKRQNQNKQNTPNLSSTCCFICQKHSRPKTPLPQATIQRRAPATMPPNALLAYLTPLQSVSSSSGRGRTRSPSLTTAIATATSDAATTQPHPDQTPCTFCERSVCSDCLGQCQDCQQVYCSLCRTTDYNSCNSSRLERTLCLDCAAVCNETGDSMNLD